VDSFGDAPCGNLAPDAETLGGRLVALAGASWVMKMTVLCDFWFRLYDGFHDLCDGLMMFNDWVSVCVMVFNDGL